MNKKGILYIDVYLLIITALFVFFVFFYLIETTTIEKNHFLKDIVITENSMKKSNAEGFGFATKNKYTKIVSANIIENLKIKDPIKSIIVKTISGKEFGNDFECKTNKKIVIERFGYYAGEVAKFQFIFCEK